ncbi:MAG: selenide, water dikinase SelD, partial [Arenicellales bacterium]
ATVHALSDLYAAAAMPQSAMLLASLPHMHSTVTSRDLEQILAGVVYELNQAGCELSGGHTSEAAELSLGMVVNGYMHQVGSDVTKQVDPGDKIIITKALGVGVIMAADMRARSTGQVVQGAIRSMLVSNALAAKILRQNNASCMTDITGFGLIGHLHGLLQRAGVGSELILEQVPLLDGAQDLSVMGFRSSLYSANLRFADFVIQSESVQQASAYPLLFDPQTSGGLIAAVPGENVQNCIDQLHAGGHQDATVVGTIIKPCDNQFPIQIFHDN